MTQEVQLFQKENLGQVRIIGDKEKPLFCLKDVVLSKSLEMT